MRLRLFRVVLACLPMLSAVGQTPFRVDVKLVDVSVSVRDSEGRLVTGLGQDDFDVFEDGAPQKIAFFARSQDVPLNLGLIVDFSGSQDPFLKAHHKDLETFLGSVLSPVDRAYLLCFGNYLRVVSEFTSSPNELLAGLQAYEKGRRSFPELGPAEDREAGTAFYDAIYYSSTEMLAKVEHGRRALIVFSDGEDNSSAHNMMEALETAQSNDVVLYGVRYTDVKNGRLNSRNKYGTSVMARMAQDTGGADFDARKTDMASEFKSIGEQLRSSYELAYHSSNPANDGLFRKISVTVKRPGVTVRAKTGYYAR
jgi:Ca-activated chloride channel family protein